MVEQDVLTGMGKPKESAQRNREYLAPALVLSAPSRKSKRGPDFVQKEK